MQPDEPNEDSIARQYREYREPDDRESESDLRWKRVRRRHNFLTAFLILLVAGLAAVAWYAYPVLSRHEAALLQFPDLQKDMKQEVASLGEQAKAMDTKVGDWASRQEELRSQVNQARNQLMARIDSAKRQASDASAALVERARGEITSQMANQIDGVKGRLAGLENSRQGDQAQIARLQEELVQVRGQVNQQAQELASVRSRVDENAASSERELASVKTNQQRDRSDFDAYADKFAVKRVNFEVTKNHSSLVAPGISLQVNGTDVSYQRVNGSVWLASDHHTIWLRQLKVQEPVFLTSFADGRTRELVITSVSKGGAVGYALVPAQDGAGTGVATSAGAE